MLVITSLLFNRILAPDSQALFISLKLLSDKMTIHSSPASRMLDFPRVCGSQRPPYNSGGDIYPYQAQQICTN